MKTENQIKEKIEVLKEDLGKNELARMRSLAIIRALEWVLQ